MTKLSNLRPVGRFKNNTTGKEYNIKKGTVKDRGTDRYFYLYRQNRVFITEGELRNNHTKV